MEKISVDKVDKVEKAERMVAFYKELKKAATDKGENDNLDKKESRKVL